MFYTKMIMIVKKVAANMKSIHRMAKFRVRIIQIIIQPKKTVFGYSLQLLDTE